jgi:archaetidylinositol phosphate synthase
LVLDAYRDTADKLLMPIAQRMRTVNPNHISALSLACAVVAGVFFSMEASYFLLLAALMVGLNGFLDALDGKIARLVGKDSKRGDFVDHVIDRYADVVMMVGISIGAYCDPVIGLFAVVGVMLASYMGTQAQALGLRRDYKGILGRADRLVLLMVVPLLQYLVALADPDLASDLFGYSLIAWMMIYFGVAGNITAIQRAYSAWRSLS